MKDISFSKKKLNVLVIITGILFFSMHIPFLQADPDYYISWSRGPNTDEGLNSCQVRNLVNHHDLTIDRSDNFIKTPLFGMTLFLPFKVFGTYLVVGRLTVLLISLFICGYIFSYNQYYSLFGLISCIMVLTEYHIFHFFHYCMAEMISTSLIFLGIFVIARSNQQTRMKRDSLLGASFISLAWYVKFQFVYAVAILPLMLGIFWLLYPENRKFLWRQLVWVSAFLSGYGIIYFLVWYLPNKSLFDYIMADQVTEKFVTPSGFGEYLRFLKDNLFMKGYLTLYTVMFALLFLAGLIFLFRNKKSHFSITFIALSCWQIVELHKLTLIYLPTRYMISFYFPMTLIMALVVTEMISIKGSTRVRITMLVIAALLLGAFSLKNIMKYHETGQRRSYGILNMNKYLARYDFKDSPVVGTWATSLGWNSKALTWPVWKGYFNDKDVFEAYHPAIVIAEYDEQDSNQAFSVQGIDLASRSDSTISFRVNVWDLRLYWINYAPPGTSNTLPADISDK